MTSTTPTAPTIRAQQLAEAMLAIAKVNHYMVGLTDDKVTVEEIDEAMSILINGQNATSGKGRLYDRYDLALDILEEVRRELYNVTHTFSTEG